jgi:hypothetical protein
MSPQLEVSEEVFSALQQRAEPLVDTPDSVLRKLLDLQGESPELPTPGAPSGSSSSRAKGRRKGSGAKRKRAAKGSITPDVAYERPLLEALVELGGRAATSDVLAVLDKKFNGQLMPIDYERLSRGEIRWKNRVQFVRLKLIKAGELAEGSPRGIWEITEAGERRVAGAP